MLLLVEYHGLNPYWKCGKCPEWKFKSGFSLEIGPEKVRNCFKKSSGISPILENIGPI